MNEGEQPAAEPVELTDFAVAVYRGCVLPEDYRPARTTTWTAWTADNPDDYTAAQLDLIRRKLLAGKSWVCFMSSLETICAPDFYKKLPPEVNLVRPRSNTL